MLLVHHAKDPQAVTLDLLDEVTIKVQCLKIWEILQLSCLLEVLDVVAVEVKGLKIWEIQELFVDILKIVIGEIKPFEFRWVKHHKLQDIIESFDSANLIVIQEESCTY
jgi:hypothetical protein